MFIIVDVECQTEEMEVSVPQSSDIITMIDSTECISAEVGMCFIITKCKVHASVYFA